MNRRSFKPVQILAVALAASASLGGCSLYRPGYYFEPRPVDVEVAVPDAPDAEPAHILVTVFGIRRADDEQQLPESIEVRLRIENTSPYALSFDPSTLTLFSADLAQFANPIARPPGSTEALPGASAVVDAFFAFPPGTGRHDFDLSGLNLRWTIQINDTPITSTADFVRRREYYPDRYYPYSHFHFGLGLHYYHCD